MTTVISGNETTSQLASSDDLLITQTGSVVTTTTAITMTFTGGTTSVLGSVFTDGVRALGVLLNGNDSINLTVGSTGYVMAIGDLSSAVVVFPGATNAVINNSGHLEGRYFGVVSTEEDTVVTNTATGTIIGGRNQGGTSETPFAAAVGFTDFDGQFINAGTVIAEENVITGNRIAVSDGDVVTTTEDPDGFVESIVSDFTFKNTGEVFGDVLLGAGDDTLVNAGFISGLVDLGDDADSYDGRGGVVDGFIDLGGGEDEAVGGDQRDLISGGDGLDTIYGGDGDDALNGNGGTDSVQGDGGDDGIFGEGGSDTLYGGDGNDFISGGSSGDFLRGNAGDDMLFGGDGNDSLQGGSGDDELTGDRNNDRLFGGKGDDQLQGNEGNDGLVGGAGADTLNGNENSDNLFGSGGDDFLDGGTGSDFLQGGSGDDILVGGGGGDEINGGSGDDSIAGGGGRDELRGGSGSDTFFFVDASDSADGSNRDVIEDFKQGVDLIDLSEMASFTFIGTGAFTGNGPEIRATSNSSGNTIIRLDVDGDGASDSRIELENVSTPLTEADFVL